MVLAALAAWQMPERRRVGRLAGSRLALAMPTLITLTGLTLLIYGNVRSLGTPALVLATIALLAAAGRAVLAFRDVRVLAVTRKQAITDELTGLANRRQGFFLSPPLPAAEITEWLRAQSSAEADRAADADRLGDLAAEHQ